MPTYTYLNKNTNVVEDHKTTLADLDEFRQLNPHLERYFDSVDLPVLSDALRMSVPRSHKSDSSFEKYVIDRIKESVPGNTLKQNHKTRSGNKEW
jgi:hypothetical protein